VLDATIPQTAARQCLSPEDAGEFIVLRPRDALAEIAAHLEDCPECEALVNEAISERRLALA